MKSITVDIVDYDEDRVFVDQWKFYKKDDEFIFELHEGYKLKASKVDKFFIWCIKKNSMARIFDAIFEGRI